MKMLKVRAALEEKLKQKGEKREDIGARKRKHELRILTRAGIKPNDDARDIEMEGSEAGDIEDDFYEQAKQNRAAKLAAKAVMPRSSSVPSLPETVDGRRYITYEMEKNRGLTRTRNKDIKNPKKKYKVRHEKKIKNWKGQVREIKKPMGPYDGETSGINPTISRSTRFKN